MMHASARRSFLRTTGTAAAAAFLGRRAAYAAPERRALGMFVYLDGKDPDAALAPVQELGFSCCEIYLNSFGAELAARVRAALERRGIFATALFASGPGPQVYDFLQGPETIGLVPRQWRRQRLDALKEASDFAAACGIVAFETHCGFIPENPNDPLYRETVDAIRELAAHCAKHRQTFLYHAGQETPVTLLRTITDVGLENQGVGLDTANLIMYGKGHPTHALDVYGRHVKAVNVKDGLYPTDPKNLGKETPLGKGAVDFPRFFTRLKECGYAGPIIIEREISGPQLYEDLRQGKAFVEKLL